MLKAIMIGYLNMTLYQNNVFIVPTAISVISKMYGFTISDHLELCYYVVTYYFVVW